jgi:hypothetical protein
MAISDAYNTLAFATPLLELPMDNVTPRESMAYGTFRQEYLQLWRRYFDPVGMRLSLRDKRVRVETYILPLIDDNGYSVLRMVTGEGTTKLDLASLLPRTLGQLTIHTGPLLGRSTGLGDQIFLRWDDSPKFRELMELWVRQDYEPLDEPTWQRRVVRLAWQLPLTLGARIDDQRDFDGFLKGIGDSWNLKATTSTPAYKGVSIRRVRFSEDPLFGRDLDPPDTPKEKRFVPVVYHTQVDGFWYVSTSLDSLRDIIDHAVARRANPGKESEKVELNSSLYLAPEAMLTAAGPFRSYLEWESQRRAVANNPLWYVLHRAGVVADGNSPQAWQTALRFYGFVPVSPDSSSYSYHATTDEMSNWGYGTLRRPELRPTLPANSPLARWLDQLRTVRVDLRFREDGVQTILTLDRHPAKK